MKKIIFITCCLISANCFSQIKFGVEGGYNRTNFYSPDGIYCEPINSFKAGFTSAISLGKKFFLQPSLSYFGNGSKNLYPQGSIPEVRILNDVTVRLYYVKLSINIIYKINLSKDLKMILGAGFYAARGINGSEKGYTKIIHDTGEIDTIAIDNKIKFSSHNNADPKNNTEYVKPFEFGYNFLAGIDWKNFQMKATYSHGFNKMHIDDFDVKNISLSLSLAYFFLHKK